MTPLRPAVTLPSLSSIGNRLSRVSERWIPDSWVICMMLTAAVFALAIGGADASLHDAMMAWGGGLWTLLELTMQLSIAMIAAHASVSSRPVHAMLERLASVSNPERPRQAVVVMALYSLVTAYFNWALSIVASALFVPFVCRRNPKTDVRVLVAAAYLGNGTIWHGGLSGSAPLILATPGNPLLAPSLGAPVVDRVVPVSETLFSTFNIVYLLVIAAVALIVVVLLHPEEGRVTLSADQIDAFMPRVPAAGSHRSGPAGWLDSLRLWPLMAAVLILYPVGLGLLERGLAAWNINSYNAVFFALALLLHGRPTAVVKAFYGAASTAAGLILQFPFYAGIFGVMKDTALGAWLGSLFVSLAAPRTFPFVVYVYSMTVNMFVPSGGSKWLIEAPYLLPAAAQLDVSTTTTLLAYAYGDMTSNLIQPFWAIPVLSVTGLRFGDILGYTAILFVTCAAVTAAAMWLIPLSL